MVKPALSAAAHTPPTFPRRTFDIRRFGARSDAGRTRLTPFATQFGHAQRRAVAASIGSSLRLPFGREQKWGRDWSRGLDALFGGWQLSGTF